MYMIYVHIYICIYVDIDICIVCGKSTPRYTDTRLAPEPPPVTTTHAMEAGPAYDQFHDVL